MKRYLLLLIFIGCLVIAPAQTVVRRPIVISAGASFPVNGVLDNFNRTNEGPPLSSSWTDKIVPTDGALSVVGNAANGPSGGYNSAWWNVTTFAANQEVYATNTNTTFGGIVALRLTNPGTASVNGYAVEMSTTNFYLYRIDSGVLTQLGAAMPNTSALGDSFGASMIGTTITAYYKPAAGTWTSIGSRTDATYGSAGAIGMIIYDPGYQDDFGGGASP